MALKDFLGELFTLRRNRPTHRPGVTPVPATTELREAPLQPNPNPNRDTDTIMSDLTSQPSQVGIKETTEAAVGAKMLARAVRQAFADDRLSFEDLGFFLAAQSSIIQAIEGAPAIKEEALDLQRDEAIQLAEFLYDFLFEFVALVKVLKTRGQ